MSESTQTVVASSSQVVENLTEPKTSEKKGRAFWLTFVALVVCTFLSALDLTSVSTALPTITHALNGNDDFVWLGTAYALSSTAFLPLSGNLADVFGRRPVMMGVILVFAVGSALAGAAQSMAMMIAARTLQGIGGGGIISLAETITSDIVPLAERGLYQGIIAMTWSFASGIGPPVGGAVSSTQGKWRWLFYINLPLCGIAFVLVTFFLQVRTPPGSAMEKLARIDWLGNVIVIIGTTLAMIGLTWAGIRFPWSSGQVLGPLISGLGLIGVFFLYEWNVPRQPTIPWEILANRTSLGGYLATFIHGITSIAMIYYMPVYFQACFLASPIRSGVDLLASGLVIAPWALIAGAFITVFNKYTPPLILGWVFMVVGFGLLSTLEVASGLGKWVGYLFILSAGIGIYYPGTIFPILAPLPVSRTAAALAFLAYLRSFGSTWGITISSTILQNQLKKKLPPAFTSQFPDGVAIAYAAIPELRILAKSNDPEQQILLSQVRTAFAESLSVIWKTMIGIAGVGLIALLMMKEIPMRTEVDENYTVHKKVRENDIEAVDEKGEAEVSDDNK